jgi:rare lipoprotein A
MIYHFQKIFLIVFIISFIVSCAPSPRFTRARNVDTISSIKENLDRYEDYPVLETQTGIASFYADKYHGKITYSGDVYDMNGISAAHQTYRMDTIIRVTNLSNGKKIILSINDRMPFWEDRIIDLSLGTARELDFIEQGLTEVQIEVLKWGEGRK